MSQRAMGCPGCLYSGQPHLFGCKHDPAQKSSLRWSLQSESNDVCGNCGEAHSVHIDQLCPESQPDAPTFEQLWPSWKAGYGMTDSDKVILKAVWLAAEQRATRAALEAAAKACEANFKGCDKSNVACHKLDAEAIHRLSAPAQTPSEEEK